MQVHFAWSSELEPLIKQDKWLIVYVISAAYQLLIKTAASTNYDGPGKQAN